MAVQSFNEQGPGHPALMRVNPEDVPEIVQSIVLCDDVLHFHLFDGTTCAMSALQCGGLYSDPDYPEIIFARAEEIFLMNWSEFVKTRNKSRALAETGNHESEEFKLSHGLH